MRAGRAAAFVASLWVCSGCGGGAQPVAPPPAGDIESPPASSAPAASSETAAPSAEPATAPPVDPAQARMIESMLDRVMRARGLPMNKPIQRRTISRPDLVAHIRAKVEREIPADVLELQGESLTALELLPADYDFVAGALALLGGRIAGLYEPDDRTMYLVDDLDRRQAEETLAHELVHALQDQSWELGPLIKFEPGASDRIGAAHALVEGDATSAMLDVMIGSAFHLNEDDLRRAMAMSTALSPEGAETPTVLQASLTAPYTDGFRFVQALRKKGGWDAVDRAWNDMPVTTEQLLHTDKYEAREKALPVPTPTIDALGAGFDVAMEDSWGEQGLRIAVQEWSSRAQAEVAAAGWGGDRYVVALKGSLEGDHEVALALRLRMDSTRDAKEVVAILERRFGRSCKERTALGPVTWAARRADVALVAGPYQRSGRTAKGTGDCATARRWASAVLNQK